MSETHPVIDFWVKMFDAKFTSHIHALFLHPDLKDEMYVFAGRMTTKIDTAKGLLLYRIGTIDSEGLSETIDSLKAAGFTWVLFC